MSVLPLNWPDKVDSPELLAWLQQSGIEKYIDAAQINSIRDALNELHSRTADTRIVENTGYEIVGTDVVINQLWKWLIISILYSNDSEITLPITLSSSGKQKICFLCANQNNGFELVYGPESDTNPAAPTIGNDLLYITFFVVTDGIISQPEAPISGSLFKRKYESQKFVYNLSGTNQVIQLRSAGHSHYEIQGTVSSISGFGKAQLNRPSSEQPYAGKDIYIENKTGQDLTLKNAMSGVDISFEFSGDLIIPDNGFVWLKVNFFGNKLVFIMKSWDDPVDLSSKADLVGGKVPASQLPAYVDDVLEFANLSSFPATGETGKIYVALNTNLTYRWSGSVYTQINNNKYNREEILSVAIYGTSFQNIGYSGGIVPAGSATYSPNLRGIKYTSTAAINQVFGFRDNSGIVFNSNSNIEEIFWVSKGEVTTGTFLSVGNSLGSGGFISNFSSIGAVFGHGSADVNFKVQIEGTSFDLGSSFPISTDFYRVSFIYRNGNVRVIVKNLTNGMETSVNKAVNTSYVLGATHCSGGTLSTSTASSVIISRFKRITYEN